MTLDEIKKFAGYKTGIINTSGQLVDNLVSDAELNTYVNARYKELFWTLAEKYPFLYEVTSTTDLVADQGQYSIGVGSDAETNDAVVIRQVGIKYTSTASKYTFAKPRSRKRIITDDDSTTQFVQSDPYYYLSAIKLQTGKKVPAITILPTPDTDVTDGLKVRYIEAPLELSDSTDIPEGIPTVAHHLIALAVVPDIWQAKGDMEKSDLTYQRYIYKLDSFLKSYQPLPADEVVRFTPDKSYNPLRK